MEAKRKIVNVYCPFCVNSMVRPGRNLMIANKLADKVLHFVIIGANNRKGELELSLIPGDYSKYSTIPLQEEEEITLLHSHESCRKSLNEGPFARVLVQHDGSKELYEHFLVTKYGVEKTFFDASPTHMINASGIIVSHPQKTVRKIVALPRGRALKDVEAYLRHELEKINNR